MKAYLARKLLIKTPHRHQPRAGTTKLEALVLRADAAKALHDRRPERNKSQVPRTDAGSPKAEEGIMTWLAEQDDEQEIRKHFNQMRG